MDVLLLASRLMLAAVLLIAVVAKSRVGPRALAREARIKVTSERRTSH
jgi:hypothetical protein